MIGKILYRLVHVLLILFLVILKAKYIFSLYCDIISGIFDKKNAVGTEKAVENWFIPCHTFL